MKETKNLRLPKPAEDYGNFDQLDGDHPWATKVPEGMIKYPVRQLQGGRVSYFNFELAKEMGLVPKHHGSELNKKLEQKILQTFNLRIINEYDQLHDIKYPASTIKPKQFMATRYLQLQHADKTGRTSGDGRCIWNGQVYHRGQLWDVSSRGTGVTQLAPGFVQAGQPLKSGNRDHGYGCGMAEIDELYGAAILAEIFHRNGIPTERVLAIVDLGKGIGIGVRAAPNLIRPAHLFLFLKQGKLEPLKSSVDYLIDRQFVNKRWEIKPTDKDRYVKMLNQICVDFASFTGKLDRDYIFAWLDWDGDNVLADAGIIDYGSIRQFGLRHDQYRYDDVERMSTNLNEQRKKAREIVQTFVQLVDYLQTGVKKSRGAFAKSPWLKEFDRQFRTACLERFLYQQGFPEPLRRLLMTKHRKDVEQFFNVHVEFERVKTYRKMIKVADGVHRPAIFNMRIALAQMADYVYGLPQESTPLVEAKEFFGWILSNNAGSRDRKLTRNLEKQITKWQEGYLKLMRRVSTPATWSKITKLVKERADRINHDARITGNALIHIVDQIIRFRRRGLSDMDVQNAIEELIHAQTLNPDISRHASPTKHPMARNFLTVVHGYREDI